MGEGVAGGRVGGRFTESLKDGRRSKTVASLVSVMIGEPISIVLARHHARFTDFTRALSPNLCFPIELPDARHFILQFQCVDRAHHFGDGDPGVIGPEDAAILVFVVMETNSVTVNLPERFSIPQL